MAGFVFHVFEVQSYASIQLTLKKVYRVILKSLFPLDVDGSLGCRSGVGRSTYIVTSGTKTTFTFPMAFKSNFTSCNLRKTKHVLLCGIKPGVKYSFWN